MHACAGACVPACPESKVQSLRAQGCCAQVHQPGPAHVLQPQLPGAPLLGWPCTDASQLLLHMHW
jgi:hypothetical protein